jgi:dienelactone hydrolase
MWYFKLFTVLTIMVLFASRPVLAETAWVSFKAGDDTVRALIARPAGKGPHAAVIYNHGTIVRTEGYDDASERGYDTSSYVQALADAGFIGLAPIRGHLVTANYATAISGGVETVKGAIKFLAGRADVDGSRIGAIGFSEGGLVTLWSAIEAAKLRAVVLMSPASMRGAGDKQLKTAARKHHLRRLTMPIFLTVGDDDYRSIRRVTARRLIPNMEDLGKTFTYKTDYPGDHKWFWDVQPDHFSDVKAFLAKHLK